MPELADPKLEARVNMLDRDAYEKITNAAKSGDVILARIDKWPVEITIGNRS